MICVSLKGASETVQESSGGLNDSHGVSRVLSGVSEGFQCRVGTLQGV